MFGVAKLSHPKQIPSLLSHDIAPSTSPHQRKPALWGTLLPVALSNVAARRLPLPLGLQEDEWGLGGRERMFSFGHFRSLLLPSVPLLAGLVLATRQYLIPLLYNAVIMDPWGLPPHCLKILICRLTAVL